MEKSLGTIMETAPTPSCSITAYEAPTPRRHRLVLSFALSARAARALLLATAPQPTHPWRCPRVALQREQKNNTVRVWGWGGGGGGE